jgi:predicted RNA-binding Zn-ribbon protein involved in translation (DUF1610 family)
MVPLGAFSLFGAGWLAWKLFPAFAAVAAITFFIAVIYGFGMLIFWIYAGVRKEIAENLAASRNRKRQCVSCGYSLRGNTSGTCPECGTETKSRDTGKSQSTDNLSA